MTEVSSSGSPENKAAFVIHIRYRQNSTWQGEIKWIGENKTQYFRSTLEMMKLIDGALDKEYGETPKIVWE
jgi:hypothetical protein